MKKLITLAVALGLAVIPAYASGAIRIVGSSTVYPFTTTVAEQFAKKNGVSAPIVESTGTGGGIKLFCAGNGPDTPDAVNASRPMKDEEKKICAENGVENITEMAIGIDAIVLAMSKDHPGINLSTNDIYRALAKYVVVDGKFVENSVKTWNEVRSDLPTDKIEVLGPPPTSGTRDSFVELVFEKECKADIKKNNLIVSEEDTKAFCQSVREDGAYIEAGENDNLIVQKLQSNSAALGIFGYSFLEENLNTIQGAKVNDVAPEYDAIAAGDYPIARKLYVYFKGSHFDSNPDLKKFMEEYKSDEAIGEEGYLAEKGLIPLK
jgi:phosphate transport system substrate-binding protein